MVIVVGAVMAAVVATAAEVVWPKYRLKFVVVPFGSRAGTDRGCRRPSRKAGLSQEGRYGIFQAVKRIGRVPPLGRVVSPFWLQFASWRQNEIAGRAVGGNPVCLGQEHRQCAAINAAV